MKAARIPGLLCILVAGALSGCASALPPAGGGPAPQPPTVSGCQAEPAQGAVGQVATATVIEEARQRAGAHSARVLRPGQVVTMEFNESRLNLDVDAASRVVRVRCG